MVFYLNLLLNFVCVCVCVCVTRACAQLIYIFSDQLKLFGSVKIIYLINFINKCYLEKVVRNFFFYFYKNFF